MTVLVGNHGPVLPRMTWPDADDGGNLLDLIDDNRLSQKAQAALVRIREQAFRHGLTGKRFRLLPEEVRREIDLLPQVGPKTGRELFLAIETAMERLDRNTSEPFSWERQSAQGLSLWAFLDRLSADVTPHIERALDGLASPRHRDIVVLSFGLDLAQRLNQFEIADKFGITPQRVHSVIKQTLARIRQSHAGRTIGVVLDASLPEISPAMRERLALIIRDRRDALSPSVGFLVGLGLLDH